MSTTTARTIRADAVRRWDAGRIARVVFMTFIALVFLYPLVGFFAVALRSDAGMVRPEWATVVTSTPSVTRTLSTESTARRRATSTGTGPMPGISHSSPSSTWPRTRAAWSTRTWTVAVGVSVRHAPPPVAPVPPSAPVAGTS